MMEFPGQLSEIDKSYSDTQKESNETLDALQRTQDTFKTYLTHCH